MFMFAEIRIPDRVLDHGLTVTEKIGEAGVVAVVEIAIRGVTERTDGLAAGPP